VLVEYLADTSAWNRSGAAAVSERWSELVLGDRIATCSPVRLELLYSARSPADYGALDRALDSLPELPLDSAALRRAHEVQARLASASQHRGAPVIDLYVAATAELNGAILLHYDRHFDAIARVTGQPAEWIAPRGTID
jgi:predicted nucleic acid-binding protein